MANIWHFQHSNLSQSDSRLMEFSILMCCHIWICLAKEKGILEAHQIISPQHPHRPRPDWKMPIHILYHCFPSILTPMVSPELFPRSPKDWKCHFSRQIGNKLRTAEGWMGRLSQGKKKNNIPSNFHLAHSDFPWAFFPFQFCNSCLFSVKLTPSVSDSFTLNSSADSFREKRFRCAPSIWLWNRGLSGMPGRGGLWETAEQQVKRLQASATVHRPLLFPLCFRQLWWSSQWFSNRD